MNLQQELVLLVGTKEVEISRLRTQVFTLQAEVKKLTPDEDPDDKDKDKGKGKGKK